MKQRRILTGLVVVLFCTAMQISSVNAQVPMDFLIHQYRITVSVHCMDETLRDMSLLPGFELSSQINLVDGRGHAVRMVLNRDLDIALETIREFGDVTHFQSNATSVFARWSFLRAESAVRSHEYDRLVELLYSADGMNEFNQIERRLREVISYQERIQGQLNSLEFDIGSAQISIFLTQLPQYEETPEDSAYGRLRQISNAFFTSMEYTFMMLQLFALFLVYISLPLALVIIVLVVVLRAYSRASKRRKLIGVSEVSVDETISMEIEETPIIKDGENNEEN